MKKTNQPPRWLRRLGSVKAEMKVERFPRTAQAGFRQCLELSAVSLHLLREGLQGGPAAANDREVTLEVLCLLARMSHAEARRTAKWKRDRVCYFEK